MFILVVMNIHGLNNFQFIFLDQVVHCSLRLRLYIFLKRALGKYVIHSLHKDEQVGE